MTEVLSEESICRMKWSTFVLTGVMSLLFGFLFFFFPELTAEVVVTLLGIIIIVLAIFAIVLALQSRVGDTYSSLLLIVGIIGFFAGMAAIVSPLLFGAVISLIIGGVLLVIGAVNIVMGFSEKETGVVGACSCSASFPSFLQHSSCYTPSMVPLSCLGTWSESTLSCMAFSWSE